MIQYRFPGNSWGLVLISAFFIPIGRKHVNTETLNPLQKVGEQFSSTIFLNLCWLMSWLSRTDLSRSCDIQCPSDQHVKYFALFFITSAPHCFKIDVLMHLRIGVYVVWYCICTGATVCEINCVIYCMSDMEECRDYWLHLSLVYYPMMPAVKNELWVHPGSLFVIWLCVAANLDAHQI